MFLYLTTWAQLKSAQLKDDCRGVTALEYGLIAGLIAVVIITAVSLVGTNLSAEFNAIAGHLGAIS
jgi:pilus assembly protein Flp/PilA